ncbi:mitogen-activated protein kinase-binding protein 1 [Polymixia lowei]
MTGEGTTIKSRIKNLLRSPSIKLRRSKAVNNKDNLSNKVTLEKVLGITAPGNRALACDPRSGLVAYPAGCVVVLLNPRKNKQHHIFNRSRKALTTLSFSPDGKYVVTGESGHMPAVRVWGVSDCVQVAELQEHKYGVACVAFSPNSRYIVSVGYQHDMIVNVWNWKKNVVVAANKVSSKVTAVSFSDDSSYFVTAGNRHVKFWYLDHNKSSKVNATVPLLGRSGLLGELRNNFFSDVACGRGKQASSTFCITSSGLLCEFNDRRLLDKWVELRRLDSVTTSQATCLCVTEELIFCGCADGTVRAFSPGNLHFLCTLPRPHGLGSDIANLVNASQLFSCEGSGARYPDTVAVSYDPASRWLSCVYNDHSLYVWDVRDLHRAGKLYSSLYHSSCVWSLEVFPEGGGGGGVCLPPGSFISCSSDNTIRLWNTDGHSRNIISHDLQKIIYMDNNVMGLLDTESVAVGNLEKAGSGLEGQTSETRTGIRTMCLSPDGQHLASGDRMGILRIHDLESMEEILNVQAHDSEILCLEYSQPETGLKLLATASRDRLIHVLDAAREYSLLQTLDEHSSSITAVRFAANEGKVRMISCGADKSIYFRTAQKTEEGVEFSRTHHIARKTTLYDMDIDPTRKYAAIGCQDRSIRIFNISNGKQKKMYKGSQGEDGTLIKVQTDPSGLYIATSCSDKNISIFDFYSGECVATMYGHSEIVTGMKFTNDCKHLITVSGDSCIFVWRLSPELTINMRQRLSDLRPANDKTPQHIPGNHSRKEVHSSPPVVTMSSDSDKEEEEEEEELVCPYMVSGGSLGEETEPSHEKFNSLNVQHRDGRKEALVGCHPPRRRWSRRTGSADGVLMVKSMLDLRQLESYSFQNQNQEKEQEEELGPVRNSPCSPRRRSQGGGAEMYKPGQGLGSTVSLQVSSAWAEESELRTNQRPDFIHLSPESPDQGPILYPASWERVSLAGSEYEVKESRGPRRVCQDKHSPDSACSLGYCPSSRHSSPDRPPGEDSEPTEPLSMDGNSSELEEEEEEEDEEGGGGGGGGEEGQGAKPVPQTPDQEAFLKQHFVTLADLSNSGSPTRTLQNSSENVSMSSRFLSQGTQGSAASPLLLSRAVFPFPSKTTGGGGGGGGEVGKAKPLVSEVRPLMEQNQARSQDQTQNQSPALQDQTQNQNPALQDQVQTHNRTDQDHQPWTRNPPQAQYGPGWIQNPASRDQGQSAPRRLEEVDVPSERSFSSPLVHRPSPLRRKAQAALETRRTVGATARAVASHLSSSSASSSSSSGLRKAQSVHSLLPNGGEERGVDQPVSRPSREVLPQRPTTLPSTPRRTLPPAPPQLSGSSSPGSREPSVTAATVTPRKASRSYMSPTTSSMAKMSRSVSMGDGLNVLEPAEDSGEFCRASAVGASLSSSSCSQVNANPPSPPVAVVPSSSALATPPHATVVPTIISGPSSSCSLGNHGNPAAHPPRGLHAKLNGSRPPLSVDVSHALPDKPSLTCFSPSAKTSSSSSSCPPPSSVSPLPSVQPPSNTADLKAPAQSSATEHWSGDGVVPTTELRVQAQEKVPQVEERPVAEQEKTTATSSSPEQREDSGSHYLSVSVESCRAVATELQHSLKKASHFYRMVNSVSDSSPEQQEMTKVLSEVFHTVRAELNSLPLAGLDNATQPSGPQCMLGSAGSRGGEVGGATEERTLALLDQYSQLLLQAVEKRLDHKLS